jgi:hypothetical protein
MKRHFIIVANLAALAVLNLTPRLAAQEAASIPSPVAEQKLSGSLELGNRWVQNVNGSSDVYRSVVNLGEGPRVFGGQVKYRDTSGRRLGWLDASALGWGGDPYNTARVEGGLRDLYSFRFDYRNVAYFNALPSFANPLLADGIFTSQRSFDITRRLIDTELEIKPNSTISPFFSFYRGQGFGRGVTTFVSDGNEFPVTSNFDDDVTSFRGGVRFKWSNYNLTVEQGRTTFGDEQQIFLQDGPIAGNRRTPLLGQTLRLDNLVQQYDAESRGIFNRGVVQGRPWDWLNFSGQFLYSQPSVDVRYNHEAGGNLILFQQAAPYTSQLEDSLGSAKRPHSSGSWNTELRPIRGLRVVQSWYTDRFHIAGGSVLKQTFDTIPAAEIETETFNLTVVNYNQHQIDAIYDLHSRVSVRGGHRYVWGDALTRPATLQFSDTPRNAGNVRRHVGLAGANARLPWNVSLDFDFEASPGDETFFRTGLMEYQRAKLRARYRPRPSLTFTGSFSMLNNENPAAGSGAPGAGAADTGFDLESRQTSLAVFWAPNGSRWFNVLADYTRATFHSEIPILSLPFFGSEIARYRDNGHHGSLFADLGLPRNVRLALGGSLSVNTGSRPTRYYQPQARLTAPVANHVSWTAEWRWFGFKEKLFSHENFRTHIFAAGLRLEM